MRCKMSNSNNCESIDSCDDNFRKLLALSVHYQRLRTLIRQLYKIRQLNLNIVHLDQYLLNGQIKDLAHLTQFDVMDIFDEKPSFFSVTGKINYNESTYQQYLKIYTDDFQKKLSSFECISCHRLFVKERVRELKNEELENEIIKKLSTNYEKDTYFISDPGFGLIQYTLYCTKYQYTYRMYIITPKDQISQDLSYFSGPRTSGAEHID